MALAPLFFYGTLRHLPLLETVLGRSRNSLQIAPAVLPGHMVNWVRGEDYPMISIAPGKQAEGLMLMEPTAEDVARLEFYEVGFCYDLREVDVIDADGARLSARVFFLYDGAVRPGAAWRLEEWVRDWAALHVEAATEAMGFFGTWSPQDLSAVWPLLRRRASTVVAAQHRRPTMDHVPGAERVDVVSRKRVHSHFFALDRMVLRHPRFDGKMSGDLDREIFLAGQAVVLLPYDPVRDQVILVQQFRANMFALGDPSPWMVEVVAGLIDPGETPQEAAIREAREEAGVSAQRLELISETYSSTGSSTEFVTSFLAIADFDELSAGGGLDEEGEDIRRLVLSFDEFAAGLAAQRFRDAPLIAAGYWLMLNRDRLRGSA